MSNKFQYSRKTSDGLVASGLGVLHSISIAPQTGSATAGLITIYDSTTETGTVIWSGWAFATAVTPTVILDVVFTKGCYVGFDGTAANIAVTVAHE